MPADDGVFECWKCGAQIKRKPGQGGYLLKLEIRSHIAACENPQDWDPLGYLDG